MQLPNAKAIRNVYEQVLNEALAFASARVTDAAGAAQVKQAFEARIPAQLPADLMADAANPKLRQILQRRAAAELIEVCHQFTPSHPSRNFVTEVASKASEWNE